MEIRGKIPGCKERRVTGRYSRNLMMRSNICHFWSVERDNFKPLWQMWKRQQIFSKRAFDILRLEVFVGAGINVSSRCLGLLYKWPE